MSRQHFADDLEIQILENNDQVPGYPEDALSPRETFLQDQNCCCLCGDQLKFEHQVDFLQLSVIESAECDACKIKLRKRLFTLN